MKKLTALAIILIVTLAAAAAIAATDTSSLDVTASVNGTCTISSTTDVAFGVYDPTDSTDNTVGQGSATIRCTKGTSYGTYIVRTNTMNGPGANTLTYELYTDAARTVAYPDATVGTPDTAPSNGPISLDIYGKITALQDVEAGAYTESVTFTVEY